MTPEAQRLAIEQACGFKRDDFLNDLNAMNAVEQWLIGQDKPFMSGPQPSDQYEYWLCMVVLERSQWENGCWKGERKDTLKVAMATAAQRAEAFLRTKGLWKD